ncbi:Ribonuclease 3 [Leucoagaricus sp. SymC.cos]|nr:Ribonuclease 3 [Leucoagaricus sp. SymC.cos]
MVVEQMAVSLLKRYGPHLVRISRHLLSRSSAASAQLPSGPLVSMALNPDFGPNDANFPPLPEIKNASIRQQVFTHRSLHGRPTHVFEDHPNDLSPDNEKYEHLGDAVLGLSVTSLLMEMYPGLRVGPSTKVRAMVVGNSTLAEISMKYQLPMRLRLHAAQAIALRASHTIQADVFESFVGGLYLDQGLEVIRAWLDKLLGPYTKAAYEIVRQQHGLPALPNFPVPSRFGRFNDGLQGLNGVMHDELPTTPAGGYLALFNQCLQKGNREVEWMFSDGRREDADKPESLVVVKGKKATPVWCATVRVDSEVYGKGKGTTKQLAKNEAAKQGLERMGINVV